MADIEEFSGCPSKESPEWKELVKGVGKDDAYRYFYAQKGLPEMEKIHEAIDTITKYNQALGIKSLEEATKDITKELKDINIDKDHPLSKLLDNHFERVTNHLRRLIQNKNYDKLKELLTPEGSDKPILSTTKEIIEAAKKTEDKIEQIKNYTNAVKTSILQTGLLLDKMNSSIKEMLETEESSLKNLGTTQSYLELGGFFRDFLQESGTFFKGNPTFTKEIEKNLRKFEDLEKHVLEYDKSGIISTLKPILTPPIEEFHKVLDNLIAASNKNLERAQKAKDTKWESRLRNDIAKAEATKAKFNLLQDRVLLDWIEGKIQDTNPSYYFESFRSVTDPLISGSSQFLKEGLNAVNNAVLPITIDYYNDVAEAYKVLGDRYRYDPKLLGDALLYEEEFIDQDGNPYKELWFLNKFKGAYKDKTELRQAVNKLEEQYNAETDETKKQDLKDSLDKAKIAVEDHINKYWNQKYTEEYHDLRNKIFRTEAGKLLKEKNSAIWKNIRNIENIAKVEQRELSSIELEQREALVRESDMLSNINNADGTPKTGIEREIALKSQELKTLNGGYKDETTGKWIPGMYTFEKNQQLFDKRRNDYSDYLTGEYKKLTKDSPEYLKSMSKWDEENTVRLVIPEYWEDLDSIYHQIADLTKKFKNEKVEEDIKVLNDELKSILKGNRDEQGHPIGILIEKGGAERIKEIEEEIYALRQKVTKISGLSASQQEELNSLFRKAKDGTLTKEDQEDIDELIQASKITGLSKSEKEDLYSLYEQLDDIRATIPTDYYIEAHNNLSGKYGVVIDDGGYVIEHGELTPFLKSKALRTLLKEEDYNEWFHTNHYQIQRWNPETESSETIWQRTRQWTKTIPLDDMYYKTEPSRKYSEAKLNPKYITPVKEGVTQDNKGNWLPKETKDGKYRNEKYYSLRADKSEKGRALNHLLDVNTNYHLDAQRDAPNNHKSWLAFPKLWKESREKQLDLIKDITKGNGKQLLKDTLEDVKALWKQEKDFSTNTGNFEEDLKNTAEQDRSDNTRDAFMGNVDNMLQAVRYRSKEMEINQTSTNIPRSILKNIHALKLAQKMNELAPFPSAMLNAIGITTKETPQLFGTKKVTAHPQRNIAFNWWVDKFWNGKSKAYELGKNTDVAVNYLKRLTNFSLLATRPLVSAGNLVKWSFENFVEAGGGAYNHTDLIKAATTDYITWEKSASAEYLINDIKFTPWQAQFDALTQPKQRLTFESTLGNKISKLKKADLLAYAEKATAAGSYALATGGNPFAFILGISHHRELADHYTQKVLQLAQMNATKIEQVLSDGSKKLITYKDAWENDEKGHIKLKDGIDKSWDIGGENYNKFLKTQDAINSRVNGQLDGYDAAYMTKYTSYTAVMNLRGWLISTWLNHWSSSDAELNKKRATIGTVAGLGVGAFVGHYISPAAAVDMGALVALFGSGAVKSLPRFNSATGTWWGRYSGLQTYIAKQYDAGFKKTEHSKEERQKAIQGLKALGLMASFGFLASIIVGSWGFGQGRKAEEDLDTKIADEDNAKKVLANLSYSKKIALYELLRLETQTATFSSVDQHLEFIMKFSLVTDIIEELYLTSNYLLSGQQSKKKDKNRNEIKTHKSTPMLERLSGIEGLGQLGTEESLDKAILSYERMKVR